ncbi:MAG: hypothetical protein ABI197_08770 [Granulicella sp.]
MPPKMGDTRGLGSLDFESAARDEYVPGVATKHVLRKLPQHGAGRQSCANVECSGGWKMPWKNRRRPVFEGHWGCSPRCLEAVIHRALRRERGDLRPSIEEEAPHQHRVPLGLIMLSQGLITQAQLRKALDAQRLAGQGRIGDWLVKECNLHPSQITRGLAGQWSCPVLRTEGFIPSAMALTAPRFFLEEFGLLPLRVAASRILYVAFQNRLDASVAFAMEQMSGLRVESGLLDDFQFHQAHEILLEGAFAQTTRESFSDIDTLSIKMAAVLNRYQPVNSRVVRIHQHYWLRIWLETGAYSGVGSLPGSGEDVIDTVFSFEGRRD